MYVIYTKVYVSENFKNLHWGRNFLQVLNILKTRLWEKKLVEWITWSNNVKAKINDLVVDW